MQKSQYLQKFPRYKVFPSGRRITDEQVKSTQCEEGEKYIKKY